MSTTAEELKQAAEQSIQALVGECARLGRELDTAGQELIKVASAYGKFRDRVAAALGLTSGAPVSEDTLVASIGGLRSAHLGVLDDRKEDERNLLERLAQSEARVRALEAALFLKEKP